MFYATYDQNFPSESVERAGYWVEFGEHCGDAMTHKILDHETVSSRVFYSAFFSILNSISTPAGIFSPNYFSIISLSANSNPIST